MFCNIELKGDGAAFQTHEDLAEVLLDIRNRIKAGVQEESVRDMNGNRIGYFTVGDEA
jgi:hypothetical protein